MLLLNLSVNSFIFTKLHNISKAEIDIKSTALVRLQNISIMKYQYNYNLYNILIHYSID